MRLHYPIFDGFFVLHRSSQGNFFRRLGWVTPSSSSHNDGLQPLAKVPPITKAANICWSRLLMDFSDGKGAGVLFMV